MFISLFDKYIGKIIFNTIIATLFVLVSLSAIIKFIDQLRKTGQGNYTLADAGIYTILSIPKDIEIFFSMGALLGSLIGLGILAQRSELVAMQASGFTRIKIAASVMKTAIPLVIFSMIIGEFVAPDGEQLARNYRTERLLGGSILSTQNGLWVKDVDNFIFIEQVLTDNYLIGITIYRFNKKKYLESICYANSAIYNIEKKVWKLIQVSESNIINSEQINSKKKIISNWKTTLTPNTLKILVIDPTALSIMGSYNYIKYLKHNGQIYNRYALNMWRKILQPISITVMMLMAILFIFGPLRSVSMGIRILTGISLSFLFYILDQLFGSLSLLYNIPVILGALLPSTIFFAVSIYLLLIRQ